MRTVHSVINYSPSNLIHEIVLIDDGSTRDYIVKVNIAEIKLDFWPYDYPLRVR